ncbi:MAG: tyrosine-type recombinase/integrase [Actinomycetota bacterium]|nr:tyrosine-type recombinase/integrase [Actinomycetota bacterium]
MSDTRDRSVDLVPAHNRHSALAITPTEWTAHTLATAFLAGYGSANTRVAYARDLAAFGAWCAEHDLDVLTVTRAHVDLYLRACEQQGCAPATVARRVSTLAGFFGYAVVEGHLTASPVERVKRPRVSDGSPRLGLDRTEARAFLAAADAGSACDALLARLLITNGLRVSEACSANVEDLDNERGHQILRVTGKGGKRATIPLVAGTIEALRNVLSERESGPILLDAQGERLDRHDAARIVKRLAKAAGVSKRISPHSLRHTAITAALDAGVSLRDVQDFARHADPRTTRRYDRGRDNLDRNAAHTLAAYFA